MIELKSKGCHSKGREEWLSWEFRNNPMGMVIYFLLKYKAETPVLWPPQVKSWLIGKDSDAGRDWGQQEKGTTEDEMAGWHHWLDGREFEWTPGVGDGQGGLECCDSWGHKESDMTERRNWTEHYLKYYFTFLSYSHFHFSSVAQSCQTLCDPMNCSTPDTLE